MSFVDAAEARLREDIVNNVLEPGVKLRVEELSRQYSIGVTPVREALSRLLAEGLVQISNNRGFSVPALSYADLVDLSVTRSIVESEAVRAAVENRDEEWEVGLIAAMERLRRRAGADLRDTEKRHALFDAHRQFHAALLVGCRLKRLLVIQAWLEQQQSRYYRRLPHTRAWSGDFVRQHERLTQAALTGSPDAVAAAVRDHTEIIVGALESATWLPDAPKAAVASGQAVAS